MKWILAILFWMTSVQIMQAQNDVQQNILVMNNCISQYNADNNSPLTLFETAGMLEQKQNNVVQRIRLADINHIYVMASHGGFSVNLNCVDSGLCVNLIKTNMTNAPMSSTVFFFTDGAAANSFAENFSHLVLKYKPAEQAMQLNLWKNEEGKIVLLTSHHETPVAPVAASNAPNKSTAASKKEKAELEEKEDIDEEEKPAKKTKAVVQRNKPAEKEDEDNEEKQEEKTKSKPRVERSEINPMDKADNNEKVGKAFCDQVAAIVKSGALNQFKDFEGRVTNATSNINESKSKIKGTKRNYLSWFNKKRAYIAEVKTSEDREALVSDFEIFQTELEDCLDGNWDDVDHSNDEIYANSKDEVKDIEYVNQTDKTMPSIRLVLVNDGAKFTYFLRFCVQ